MKSIRSLSGRPSGSIGSGLVGNGCVGDVQLPGTCVCVTGRSSMGQTGCAGDPVEREDEPLLRGLNQRRNRLPVQYRGSARIGTFGRS